MMPIAGYTTSVQVSGTVEKIVKMLTRMKVTAIQTTYAPNGDADGLIFRMSTQWGEREFSLPVNAEGVRQTLIRDKVEKRYQTPEQANRVAWRIAHDWLRAQLAIIDAGMVTMTEVMFPYLVIGFDREENKPVTSFSHYDKKQRALES